jgi:hypothetical protein
MIEADDVTAVIDRVYPLDKAPDAPIRRGQPPEARSS